MMNPRAQSSSRRRGSVFVLVVAILAVIALLSMTLAYSTRMELQASRNSADAVQARLSALTGVPFVTPGNPLPVNTDGGSAMAASQNSGATGLLPSTAGLRERERREFVALSLAINPRAKAASQAREGRQDQSLSAAGHVVTDLATANQREREEEREARGERLTEPGDEEVVVSDAGDFSGAVSKSSIRDESAKFNLNAILPSPEGALPALGDSLETLAETGRAGPLPAPNADHLALLIERVAAAREIRLDRSAQDLARDIVRHRYGDDGAPGVAALDDNANGGDIRPSSDGADNDGDWVIDNPEEETLAVDADGVDNDFDGVVDEQGESLVGDGLDGNHNGIIDDPGEILDDPSEFVSDIRLASRGDDRPFNSLPELTAIQGMTPELITALAPHLTVFSVSQPAYPQRRTAAQTESEIGLRQLDPNTATPEEIFAALRGQYPSHPESLLGQFSVNIVDRRDADSVPTEARLGASETAFRGLELTPAINEVFPFTGAYDRGEGGDDGQFVEIVNPNATDVDLSGWRLEGVGTTVYLTGKLQGGGVLVVTDDYNNSTDPEPENVPGQGSLYDIFGTVPVGGDTRLEVNPSLSLPDDTGAVRLLDRAGVLVDEFRYEGGKLAGALRYSFQRENPRIRKSLYTREDADYGTPLKSNHGSEDLTSEERQAMRLVEAFHNRPFRSPLEILLVPTNYDAPEPLPDPNADPAESDLASAAAESPVDSTSGPGFRLPYLASNSEPRLGQTDEEAVESETNNLDVSVADLFMPGLGRRRDTGMMKFLSTDSLAVGDSMEPAAEVLTTRIEREWQERRDAPPALLGRININTAAPVTLSALPGVGDDLAYVIAVLREEWTFGKSEFVTQESALVDESIRSSDAWLNALPPPESPRWRTLSEFLADDAIWGSETDLIHRVEAAYPFASLITFNSLSYRVVTENIPPPLGSGDRRPTVIRTERIIAGDRGKPETVRFRRLSGGGWAETDKDIRYALPAGGANDLSEALLAKGDLTPQLPRYDGPAFGISIPGQLRGSGLRQTGLGRGQSAAAPSSSAPAPVAPSGVSATDRAPLD